MKAFIYQGPGKSALEDRPKPEITAPSDSIINAGDGKTAGVPVSFTTCEEIVSPGGVIANIGVRGIKVDPTELIAHRFTLDRTTDAYETLGHAAKIEPLKVTIEA